MSDFYIKHCKHCKYAIFCPTWGEYKCTKHEIWKTRPDEICSEYAELGKNDEEKVCRCKDCEERIFEDDT